MPVYDSDRNPCHKHGMVLTCYVDGHKRFRAVRLEEDTPTTGADDPVAMAASPAEFKLPADAPLPRPTR